MYMLTPGLQAFVNQKLTKLYKNGLRSTLPRQLQHGIEAKQCLKRNH